MLTSHIKITVAAAAAQEAALQRLPDRSALTLSCLLESTSMRRRSGSGRKQSQVSRRAAAGKTTGVQAFKRRARRRRRRRRGGRLHFGGDEKFMAPSAAASLNQRRIRLAATLPPRRARINSSLISPGGGKNTHSWACRRVGGGDGPVGAVANQLAPKILARLTDAGDARGRSLCSGEPGPSS